MADRQDDYINVLRFRSKMSKRNGQNHDDGDNGDHDGTGKRSYEESAIRKLHGLGTYKCYIQLGALHRTYVLRWVLRRHRFIHIDFHLTWTPFISIRASSDMAFCVSFRFFYNHIIQTDSFIYAEWVWRNARRHPTKTQSNAYSLGYCVRCWFRTVFWPRKKNQ